jgi:hypothetical protein
VDRAVDGFGLDAGVGVAERYIRCRRCHSVAAEEHAPTVVSTVMACGAGLSLAAFSMQPDDPEQSLTRSTAGPKHAYP